MMDDAVVAPTDGERGSRHTRGRSDTRAQILHVLSNFRFDNDYIEVKLLKINSRIYLLTMQAIQNDDHSFNN